MCVRNAKENGKESTLERKLRDRKLIKTLQGIVGLEILAALLKLLELLRLRELARSLFKARI